MTEKKILIDRDDATFVERIGYELSARQSIIKDMLQENAGIHTDTFEAYHKELVEYNAKFETAKREIERKYVLPITEGKRADWTLDYATAELTITII